MANLGEDAEWIPRFDGAEIENKQWMIDFRNSSRSDSEEEYYDVIHTNRKMYAFT